MQIARGTDRRTNGHAEDLRQAKGWTEGPAEEWLERTRRGMVRMDKTSKGMDRRTSRGMARKDTQRNG